MTVALRGVEAALRIHGIAVAAMGEAAVDLQLVRRGQLQGARVVDIAEEKVTTVVLDPDWAFGPPEARCDALDACVRRNRRRRRWFNLNSQAPRPGRTGVDLHQTRAGVE